MNSTEKLIVSYALVFATIITILAHAGAFTKPISAYGTIVMTEGTILSNVTLNFVGDYKSAITVEGGSKFISINGCVIRNFDTGIFFKASVSNSIISDCLLDAR